MVLAGLLLLFLLIAGPTIFIFDTLTEAIGTYLTGIVPNSFRTGAYGDPDWLASWTIFYWAWWISWAPFVGTFIARISRGRTIREFVFGVLLVPSGVSGVWFVILGGAAIDLQLTGAADIAGAVGQSPEAGLFTTLEQFPLADVTAFLVIVLVALFFVSGADAASLVMGMLSTRGSLHPPRTVVIVWGSLTGAAAAVLLLAGGLGALQQAAIIAAAPFVLVMIGLCVSLFKALHDDERPEVVPDEEEHRVRPGPPEPAEPADAGGRRAVALSRSPSIAHDVCHGRSMTPGTTAGAEAAAAWMHVQEPRSRRRRPRPRAAPDLRPGRIGL